MKRSTIELYSTEPQVLANMLHKDALVHQYKQAKLRIAELYEVHHSLRNDGLINDLLSAVSWNKDKLAELNITYKDFE